MKPLIVVPRVMLLALPCAAMAQEPADPRDAQIERLTRTVEVLTRRVEALEAERAGRDATPARPVAGDATAPSRPPALAGGEDRHQAAMPEPSPLPDHETFDEDPLAAPPFPPAPSRGWAASTLTPESLKLVPKGKRNGLELQWADLVSGDAALAAALQASLDPRAG